MTIKVRNFEVTGHNKADVLLVVGDVSQDALQRAHHDCIAIAHFVSFSDLTPAVLATLNPTRVISAVFDEGFDTQDVADRLQMCGYVGPYIAVAFSLPDPGIIREEIRHAAPALEYDVLLLGGEGDNTVH